MPSVAEAPSPAVRLAQQTLRFLKVLAEAPGAKLPMSVLAEFSGLDPVPFERPCES